LYGVRYTELIAPLIKANQELSQKIDEATKRIEDLEYRTQDLHQAIADRDKLINTLQEGNQCKDP
jgi:short-subunit dehydrogenase involved in D-alanine esterification of teichoic acids